MFERVRRLLRDLAGRNDEVIIDLVVRQVEAASEGVQLVLGVVGADLAPADALDTLDEVAKRGDRCRSDLVVALAAVLATPMDREDLFRLSRSADDVLDNLTDLVREMDLFGIDEEVLLVPALEGVAQGLADLCDGIRALGGLPEQSREAAQAAKHNNIRHAYQRAVAELLRDDTPVTSMMLKRRMLLRRTDVIGLRLGEAADALADGTIKRND